MQKKKILRGKTKVRVLLLLNPHDAGGGRRGGCDPPLPVHLPHHRGEGEHEGER